MNNEMNLSPTLPNHPKLPIIDTIKEAWTNTKGFKGRTWLSFLIIFIITILLAIGIYFFIPATRTPLTTQSYTHLQLVLIALIPQLIIRIINILLVYGLIYMGIRRINNLSLSMEMLFSAFKYPRFFQLIGLYLIRFILFMFCVIPLYLPSLMILNGYTIPHTKIIIAICYLLGLIYFFIVGVYYLFLRLLVSPLAILDKGINPIAAIKLSYNATKCNVLRILAVFILELLVVLACLIPAFIGAYVFKHLGIRMIWCLPLAFGIIWCIPFILLVNPVIYKHLVGISTKE